MLISSFETQTDHQREWESKSFVQRNEVNRLKHGISITL